MTAKKKAPKTASSCRPAMYVTRDARGPLASVYVLRTGRKPVYDRFPGLWPHGYTTHFCPIDFESLTGVKMEGGPSSILRLTVSLKKVKA